MQCAFNGMNEDKCRITALAKDIKDVCISPTLHFLLSFCVCIEDNTVFKASFP